MTIKRDFWGYRFDDIEPQFAIINDDWLWHRTLTKMLKRDAVDEMFSKAGYTPKTGEVGVPSDEFKRAHRGIPWDIGMWGDGGGGATTIVVDTSAVPDPSTRQAYNVIGITTVSGDPANYDIALTQFTAGQTKAEMMEALAADASTFPGVTATYDEDADAIEIIDDEGRFATATWRETAAGTSPVETSDLLPEPQAGQTKAFLNLWGNSQSKNFFVWSPVDPAVDPAALIMERLASAAIANARWRAVVPGDPAFETAVNGGGYGPMNLSYTRDVRLDGSGITYPTGTGTITATLNFNGGPETIETPVDAISRDAALDAVAATINTNYGASGPSATHDGGDGFVTVSGDETLSNGSLAYADA